MRNAHIQNRLSLHLALRAALRNAKRGRTEGTHLRRLFVHYSFRALIALPACLSLLLGEVEIYAESPPGITNIFKPDSTPAQTISDYTILVLAICAVIFAIVAGLLLYTTVRYRRRKVDDGLEPPQIYGSNQLELAWTVVPILIVLVLSLVTARTIADVQNAIPPPGSLRATVVGHQWWWEIRYPELGIVTANELHVPVSDGAQRKPTFLTLESADVVHSFWVPLLAGKTDLIPNRQNRMWIEPTKPGTYAGNCAEYCGTQHTHMLIRVIVHPPGDFERWVAEQQKPQTEDATVQAGRNLFFANSCISCHTIKGTTAQGQFGPDLTHLMSRETIGSGTAQNSPEKLRAWVKDPQALKKGSLMPNMQLTDEQLDHVVSYLLTLK